MKFYIAVLILVVLSLIFWHQPQIDHWVSNLFYNVEHHAFWVQERSYLEFLRHLIMSSLVMMNFALLAILVLKIIKPAWVALFNAKTAIYILLCFLIAPGLVVNAILKDQWGRPRPHQIQEFGGAAVFQPVWKMSTQCEHNCSFVCGDCAMVFTLFAFVPLVRRKCLATFRVCVAGLTISFIRIGAGGHFFSDALLSGVMVYLVVNTLHYVLYEGRRFDEAKIDNFFNQLHKKILR